MDEAENELQREMDVQDAQIEELDKQIG